MIDMPVSNQTVTNAFAKEQAKYLLTIAQSYMPKQDVDQLARAFELAQATCKELKGERELPLLEHALAVATILAEMPIGARCGAFRPIFEAVDGGPLSIEQVERIL